jgi:outer membrane lipoprotein-sorting protein
VSNFLRRLPLSRLLLLCAAVIASGAVAAALATALGTGPTPPPKPLADAVHDSLAAAKENPVPGVSARIELTDHLIEGTSLASQGGGGASSPLLTGASGRLWIAEDGRLRVELQSEGGDTEIFYDGHTLTMYDASSNNLYRYTPPQSSAEGWQAESGAGTGDAGTDGSGHGIPTVAEIQEAIVKIMRHANLSGAIPTDVAGQAAYAVRISPSHNGGLVGGAELAWDATHGVPLRLAVYSTQSAAPVLELSATEVSYGAVADSVFSFTPPPGAKVTEITPPRTRAHARGGVSKQAPTPEHGLAAVQAAMPFTLDAPATLAGMARTGVSGAQLNGQAAALVTYGEGLGGIAVLESATKAGGQSGSAEEGAPSFLGDLPKISLPGASASELPTPLGTILRFERGGVDYLMAGSVTPATLQDAAKGL